MSPTVPGCVIKWKYFWVSGTPVALPSDIAVSTSFQKGKRWSGVSVSSDTRFLNARSRFYLSCRSVQYWGATAGTPWAPATAEDDQAFPGHGRKEHGREKSCMCPGVGWGKNFVSCTREDWMRGQWKKKRKISVLLKRRHGAVLASLALLSFFFFFLFIFFYISFYK